MFRVCAACIEVTQKMQSSIILVFFIRRSLKDLFLAGQLPPEQEPWLLCLRHKFDRLNHEDRMLLCLLHIR